MNDEKDYVVYLRNADLGQLGEHKKGIWKVIDRDADDVMLESLHKLDHVFTTNRKNIVQVTQLQRVDKFKQGYINDEAWRAYAALTFTNTNTEDTIVNSNSKNQMIDRTVTANTNAAKVAATLTAGRTLNSVVAKKIVPQLPFYAKGYADTALGRVVIANIADFAVKQFMTGNDKANMATNAMMQAAMLELAETFDFEGIVEDVLSNVSLDLSKEGSSD